MIILLTGSAKALRDNADRARFRERQRQVDRGDLAL